MYSTNGDQASLKVRCKVDGPASAIHGRGRGKRRGTRQKRTKPEKCCFRTEVGRVMTRSQDL